MTRSGPTIRYNDRVYKPGSDVFEYFKETEEAQTMSYPMADLDNSHELWQRAQAKCNVRLYRERETLIAAQTAASESKLDRNGMFDLEDIEDYYRQHGRGTHFLEFDFAADTPAPVAYVSEKSGLVKYFWCWTHKYTNVSVKHFSSTSGKSCGSGRLSKYLQLILERKFPKAYARAQRICF